MLGRAMRGLRGCATLQSFVSDTGRATVVALEGCYKNAEHVASQTGQSSADMAKHCYSRSEWRPLLPKTATSKLNAHVRYKIPSSSITGHLHCHTSAGEGVRSSKLDTSPDISMLSPELQQQWHVDRNWNLGAIKVKPYSATRAVWQCNKCPVEQPHVWTASVQSRTEGSHCPYCLNRLVCSHNSLAEVAPEVAAYWNLNKNARTPEQVLASSSCRVQWKCPICEWEWQARIGDRVRTKAGCPKCSHALRVTMSQPTFAEAQPACLAEWDFEGNDANGIYPCDITLGSGKLVHWIGSCCPRGQPHRWTASPNNRAKKGSGCPVCAGRSACVCNSLESLFPSVAAEFDVEKNGFAPSDITAQSHKKVWWRNAKRGSWRQSSNARNLSNPASRKDQAGV